MEHANEQVNSSPQAAPVVMQPVHKAATLAMCAAGWLVPGLGHLLLGRWIRGLIFAVAVVTMFLLGIAMHGKLFDLTSPFEEPLELFAFIANVGAGVPYWLAERFELGIGTMTAPSYDYGTTFLWVCGLLNYLIVLDVYDIAQGRKP